MDQISSIDSRGYPGLGGAALRRAFVVAGLFRRGRVSLRHWETDRTIIGGAVPLRGGLALPCPPALRAKFFNERRELGIINTGGAGQVVVDGRRYRLGRFDCLYVGRGAGRVVFHSQRAAAPAQFYLLSYPAHARHPTRRLAYDPAAGLGLGAPAEKNSRTLFRCIHPAGIRSCQLVMGFTVVQPGSRWNTMPPHTHLRRSEVYCYFDLKRGGAVKHFLGRPDAVRHLRLRDREAVLSPPWSIHCGVGTTHYAFVWGMGGENQDFSDMDPVDPRVIRCGP
ncbi:MAG: 5-dehydro-4-deoxy-D-glucuronate isomerase [Opitutae bacterium]|nr:5-dehydro-4-deoxy-D-glucuronate isomerase [Opitutae bacterium]